MQRAWTEKILPQFSPYKNCTRTGAAGKDNISAQMIGEVAAVEIQGKFNAQRFFDTLALILSEREKVKITVKVTQQEKTEKKAAAGQQPAAS